ncbi:hypothetical protein [Kitasatospora sp. McL0602]|uniref:hypothetical protein n=1 Tax=Kitasatospora sp. McL0602 TaxID=3439530 RepID=UPI003F889545
MAEPVNRTILLMDIEGSGRRLDVEQAVIRRMMYSVLRSTLAAASVEPSEYRKEDRGDGVFVLVNPAVPKMQLIRALLTHTPAELHQSNRLASPSAQVRLRTVLHSGEVALDEEGALGADLVEAFRLLDSDALHQALRRTDEASVLCVSEAVHHGVVRHGHPGIRAEHFHHFATEAKEGALTGWLHDPTQIATEPGRPERPAGQPSGPTHSPAPPQPSHTSALPPMQIGSGNFFFGTGAQVAGDAVAGNKYVNEPQDGRR